ncbi:hypothetical protein A2U01_0086925, partial [Trifolium medium]|nr:hypothetical protein [Trifolium medium]
VVPLAPSSLSKRKHAAATTSNLTNTPDDNASKRPRRSSRGSAKTSTACPLEVHFLNLTTTICLD